MFHKAHTERILLTHQWYHHRLGKLRLLYQNFQCLNCFRASISGFPGVGVCLFGMIGFLFWAISTGHFVTVGDNGYADSAKLT